MFRSVGSIAFGIASDRYGRKWPFVVNNLLFIVLELVSCLPQTCSHFLVMSSFFSFPVVIYTRQCYALTRERVGFDKMA